MANHNYVTASDVLTAENIYLSLGGKDILKGATIRCTKGSITGLLGRNGSGKSSTLQCLFGTLKARECDLFVNGVKCKTLYTGNRLINYLPQKPFLPTNLKVSEVLHAYGINPTEAYMWFPVLKEYEGMRVAALSGGQERLLSVTIILLADTRFTLLDEPFTNIMPLHIERIKQLLMEQKHKKGIVITDHIYEPLLAVSNVLYMLKEGQSVFIKDVKDLALHGYISASPG